MRHGIFWGFLFITIGALFLIQNFHVANINWNFIIRLWPLILVWCGLGLLFRDSIVGIIVSALFMICVLGLVIIGTTRNWFPAKTAGEAQNFGVNMTSEAKSATFRIDTGASALYIDGTTDKAIDVKTQSDFLTYKLDDGITTDGQYTFMLSGNGANFPWNFSRSSNEVNAKLNSNLSWIIATHTGASKIDMNLEPFNVTEFHLDSGASDMKVRFGERADNLDVTIKCGASSVDIAVPKGAGTEVTIDGGAIGKNIDGLDKIDSRTYRSANWDSAAKKIRINFSAGASSIKVETY